MAVRYPLNEIEPDPIQILKFLESAREEYSNNPFIREQTVAVLAGLGDNDLSGQIDRVLSFVRRNVTYVRDPLNAEYVVSPIRLLTELRDKGYVAGDCEDHVLLLNSMLGAIGFDTKFVGVKLPETSETFNHVVSGVRVGNQWILLDPCAKSGKQRNYADTLTV